MVEMNFFLCFNVIVAPAKSFFKNV